MTSELSDIATPTPSAQRSRKLSSPGVPCPRNVQSFKLRLLLVPVILLAGCATRAIRPPTEWYPRRNFAPKPEHVQHGLASFYSGRAFNRGEPTASGEWFVPWELTAAHRRLPFNTFVNVVNLRNNRSIIVRITDRGPYVRGRIIDLSKGAATILGMLDAGIVPVRIEILKAIRSPATPVRT